MLYKFLGFRLGDDLTEINNDVIETNSLDEGMKLRLTQKEIRAKHNNIN